MTAPHQSKESTKQGTQAPKSERGFSDVIATLLDSAIAIPGTTIRIGLDPLLGLIPGIGDYVSSLIGSSILFLASRSNVPRIVMFRMAMNIFINMGIGAIPGIGDLFSFWFKSNIRNAQLLHRHSQSSHAANTTIDWMYVIVLIATMFILLTTLFVGVIWMINQLWQYFS